MSTFEDYRDSIDFKFSVDQRALLFSVLPKRKSAQFLDKHRNKKHVSLDAYWAAHRELFVEDIELAVGHYFDPSAPRDGLTRRQLRDEMVNVAFHASQIGLALDRLSNQDTLKLASYLFAPMLQLNEMKPRGKSDFQCFTRPIVEMVKVLEQAAAKLAAEPLKSGPDNSASYDVAARIVLAYEWYLGKASASPNGALSRIITALKDITGITIGEDSLRRAIREHSRL